MVQALKSLIQERTVRPFAAPPDSGLSDAGYSSLPETPIFRRGLNEQFETTLRTPGLRVAPAEAFELVDVHNRLLPALVASDSSERTPFWRTLARSIGSSRIVQALGGRSVSSRCGGELLSAWPPEDSAPP
jgi:hypothetical protein